MSFKLQSETPIMASSTVANATYDSAARSQSLNILNTCGSAQAFGGMGGFAGAPGGGGGGGTLRDWSGAAAKSDWHFEQELRAYQQLNQQAVIVSEETEEDTEMAATAQARRLVRVLITDPDPLLPVEHTLLHKGDELVTDQTDAELFYDLDIGKLLKAHNEIRRGIVDKEKTGKDDKVFLEDTRISRLRMTVVTVATL